MFDKIRVMQRSKGKQICWVCCKSEIWFDLWAIMANLIVLVSVLAEGRIFFQIILFTCWAK